MARRPSYVTNALKEGEMASFDKEKQQWRIFRYTSKRVPGKTNPIKERIYVAICTPWGREDINAEVNTKPDIINFSTWEYGASRVLQQKLPVRWLRNYPEFSEAIFLDAISQVLPTSYLLRDKNYIVPGKREGLNVPMRQKILWKYYKEEGVVLDMLEPLKSILLLCLDGREAVTAPNDTHLELLNNLGVSLV